MGKISAVVHTKNSEKTIEAALKSVGFVDEIVVVDMMSQDKTVEIAKKYTNRVFKHKDVGYVEPARNFALGKAKHEWVLVLDADEEISSGLAKKIIELVKGDEVAWEFARKNMVWGKWVEHSGWWPDYVLRLFPKGSVSWSDEIHQPPNVEVEIRRLEADERLAIVHHNYEDVAEFVSRMNNYTTITAKNADNPAGADEVLVDFFDEFLRRFYQQHGFRDGEVGLYLSLIQSMYQFLVAVKTREKTGFSDDEIEVNRALNKFVSDVKYWMASKEIERSSNPFTKMKWRLRRKYRI